MLCCLLILIYLIILHFRVANVDTQTQTAYELATKGLIRPASTKEPLIYGIKCISLDLPNFIVGKY